ncbi:MAG: ribosome maturation factor RimP [Deltaproteobacteria bacterium]
MLNTSALEKIQQIAEDITASLGLEFVELEYKREGRQMILRLFINKAGGITLDDCTSVSKEFSAVLDVEEPISAKFILEVSSPGLNRALKTVDDYVKNIEQLVKVKTFEAIPDDAGNKRKTFLGTLVSITDRVITIRLQEGQRAEIPLDKVAKANLEFVF